MALAADCSTLVRQCVCRQERRIFNMTEYGFDTAKVVEVRMVT